jgi:hypothetical protein
MAGGMLSANASGGVVEESEPVGKMRYVGKGAVFLRLSRSKLAGCEGRPGGGGAAMVGGPTSVEPGFARAVVEPGGTSDAMTLWSGISAGAKGRPDGAGGIPDTESTGIEGTGDGNPEPALGGGGMRIGATDADPMPNGGA